MSVSIELNKGNGGWSMTIEFPTHHALGETRAQTVKQWAQVLDTVAADLRRMYPAESSDQ